MLGRTGLKTTYSSQVSVFNYVRDYFFSPPLFVGSFGYSFIAKVWTANLLSYNSAYKRIKKAQNRALKFAKHRKSMKILFEMFLLELSPKHFWKSWNSSGSSNSFSVEIFFKINFSPETGIANFFESKKRKFLHILLNGGMYFLKAKFESFSFEKMKFKNKLHLTA